MDEQVEELEKVANCRNAAQEIVAAEQVEELAQVGFEAANRASFSWAARDEESKKNWRNAVRAIVVKLRSPISAEGKTPGQVGYESFWTPGQAPPWGRGGFTEAQWERAGQAILSAFGAKGNALVKSPTETIQAIRHMIVDAWMDGAATADGKVGCLDKAQAYADSFNKTRDAISWKVKDWGSEENCRLAFYGANATERSPGRVAFDAFYGQREKEYEAYHHSTWERAAQAVLSIFRLLHPAEEIARAVWDAHFGKGAWDDSVRRNLTREIRNRWIVAIRPFCQSQAKKPTFDELRQMAAEQGMELATLGTTATLSAVVQGYGEAKLPATTPSALTRQPPAPDARFGRPESD